LKEAVTAFILEDWENHEKSEYGHSITQPRYELGTSKT